MSKRNNIPGGFTLIELLVAISILAILAVAGLIYYSGVQKTARDSRRRSEIDSIAKALESNKDENSTTYNAMNASQFSSGVIPQDTTTAKYCIAVVSSGSVAPPIPSVWSNTANSTACGTVTGYLYNVINSPSGSNLGAGSTAWTVCALLESGTSPNIFCKSSAQ